MIKFTDDNYKADEECVSISRREPIENEEIESIYNSLEKLLNHHEDSHIAYTDFRRWLDQQEPKTMDILIESDCCVQLIFKFIIQNTDICIRNNFGLVFVLALKSLDFRYYKPYDIGSFCSHILTRMEEVSLDTLISIFCTFLKLDWDFYKYIKDSFPLSEIIKQCGIENVASLMRLMYLHVKIYTEQELQPEEVGFILAQGASFIQQYGQIELFRTYDQRTQDSFLFFLMKIIQLDGDIIEYIDPDVFIYILQNIFIDLNNTDPNTCKDYHMSINKTSLMIYLKLMNALSNTQSPTSAQSLDYIIPFFNATIFKKLLSENLDNHELIFETFWCIMLYDDEFYDDENEICNFADIFLSLYDNIPSKSKSEIIKILTHFILNTSPHCFWELFPNMEQIQALLDDIFEMPQEIIDFFYTFLILQNDQENIDQLPTDFYINLREKIDDVIGEEGVLEIVEMKGIELMDYLAKEILPVSKPNE